MLKKRIQDVLKDSSIYGLSKIASQAIGFFLIPLYTQYLSPEDYGILNILGVASVSLGLVMTFGLDSAIYRFAGLAQTEEEAATYLGTSQWLNLSSVVLFSIVAFVVLRPFTDTLLTEQSPVLYMIIGLGVGVFSSLSSITRAFLRIKRKAKAVALASLVNVSVSLVSILLLVVVFEMGVVGALTSNLIGSAASTATIFIADKGNGIPRFHLPAAAKLFRYALPALPAQLLAFAIPLYSQWSVKEILSLEELGLYAVALKFTLPLTLVLTMFQQAYGPYKFEILKTDSNPQKIFSQIMTLFVGLFGFFVLVITVVGPLGMRWMTPEDFHRGENYIFTIALIPFAQGLYFMCSAGQEFAKSPVWRPVISGMGFLTLILTNHFLIKKFGVNGAAMSMVGAWVVMAIGNLVYSQILYPIRYQWLTLVFLSAGIGSIGFVLQLDFWAPWGRVLFFSATLLALAFLLGKRIVRIATNLMSK